MTQEGGVHLPIQCGGVLVNPGDIVVADDNGIVVLPRSEAEAVYVAARAWEDKAPFQRRWLLGGGLLTEISGLSAEEIAAKVEERSF